MPITTSQRRAVSELRMKPRRCGNQKYSSGRTNSCATSVAILFSNPAPRSFENGMLLGSAHTRSGDRALGPAARPAHSATTTPRRLQTEDIHRTSWRRVLLDVLHGADHTERRVGVVCGDLRKRDRAHP